MQANPPTHRSRNDSQRIRRRLGWICGCAICAAWGCGARTALDWPDETPSAPGAGNGGEMGGTPEGSSGGGSADLGGDMGGSVDTGGAGNGGASVGGTSGTSEGGSPMGGTGGNPATGGRGGTGGSRLTGGATGTGGLGGVVATGGRGGAGGGVFTGGATGMGGLGGVVVTGGRGGAGGGVFTGGATGMGGLGGVVVTGGRGGTAGTVGLGGRSAIAGSGGTAGKSGSSGTGGAGRAADAGVAGAGGSIGSSSGFGGASGTADAGAVCPPPPPGLDMIDDMNDGDRFILPGRGRSGAWKTAGDGTPGPGATMSPAVGGNFTMTDTGDPCRKLAVYVKGSGYALTGASFSVGLGSPYNASAYHSLIFWAKVDPGTTPRLRVSLPDKDTHPDGGLCQWTGQNLCWDHYGLQVVFTTEWTQYTIPFSSLTQKGWGNAGTGFDPASVYEVDFEIPVNAIFGIWIDDLAFLP